MSNATPSAFGWEFQYNAALVLTLENIENIESVRIEGRTEDIELSLKNGTKIYSQSKSSIKDDQDGVARTRFIEALESLSNASSSSDCNKLVYVTNIVRPLGSKSSSLDFVSNDMIIDYCDLSQTSKDIINKIVKLKKYNINLDKLSIRIVQFNGSNVDTRYVKILHAVSQFVAKMDPKLRISDSKLTDAWVLQFSRNSTVPDTTVELTKKEIVWIFIVECLPAVDIKVEGMDDAEKSEIIWKYYSLISTKCERVDFSLGVIYDFNLERKKDSSTTVVDFCNRCWHNYEEEFKTDSMSLDIREKLIKIIIELILSQRIVIENIKRNVKL